MNARSCILSFELIDMTVRKLNPVKVLIAVLALGAVSGCTRLATATVGEAADLPVVSASANTQTPVISTQLAEQSTDISDFVDPQSLAKMSENEKAEAASAQFYALQFGRPGAPRRWSGDKGATGKITVGPFVRVNELDCREFVHQVTIERVERTLSGTSCRENDGAWSVVASS
jgi:surface antigen